MTEINKGNENYNKSPEVSETYEHIANTQEKQTKTPEQPLKSTEQIKQDLKEINPVSSSELLDQLKPKTQAAPFHAPDNELKLIALRNALSEIRSQLSSTSKRFSKVIHNPVINSVSEISAKTIVRPTAILFGGIFMFIGSSVYLYSTYKIHARYNFFVALFLFFGGFVAGIIVELAYNLFFKKKA